jgi:TrmH family RNA methyltransferase
MGSFTRVNIVYTDLVEYLSKQNINIGTDMDGENIYTFENLKK